jgi:glycine hydroxymethyltransferase
MAKEIMSRGYQIVSGGTDNHMCLIDLSNTETTGKEAEEALGKAHITVNKNTVPNEKRSPFVTSGIRIGTPAVTTRGMKEGEVKRLAHWICDVLADPKNEPLLSEIGQRVVALCREFPVYENTLAEEAELA